MNEIKKFNQGSAPSTPKNTKVAYVEQLNETVEKINTNFTEIYDQVTVGKKVYKANLLQDGATITIDHLFENTLGGTVVWTHDDVGTYLGTISGAFTVGKVFYYPMIQLNSTPESVSINVSLNSIEISTSFGDDGTHIIPIYIEVYP